MADLGLIAPRLSDRRLLLSTAKGVSSRTEGPHRMTRFSPSRRTQNGITVRVRQTGSAAKADGGGSHAYPSD